MKIVEKFISGITSCSYDDLSEKIRLEGETIISNRLAISNKIDTPLFIMVAGIPGSGKTTKANEIKEGSVFVAFDSIMEDLKSYWADEQKFGAALAFANWEMPARIIGYELLQRAIEAKANIVFENSGVHEGHLELLKHLKEIGYKVKYILMECDKELAITRSEIRESSTHRHTPHELIETRYEKLQSLKDKYIAIADEHYIFNTNPEGLEKTA